MKSPKEQKPTIEELNALAHFTIAIDELRRSPFFIEEHRSLTLSWADGAKKENFGGNFPDETIVKAALVPFRRVWAQGEPCQYIKVANIVKRYNRNTLIEKPAHVENQNAIKILKANDDPDITVREIIDAWLNTNYMHVGGKPSKGKRSSMTREEFDQLSAKFGKSRFEYFFLDSVWRMGIHLFNIESLCVAPFLEDCEQRGLIPSVRLAIIGEENVTRHTPGFSQLPADVQTQRVWRLRRRALYATFSDLLEMAGLKDEQIASPLNSQSTFDNFAMTVGLNLQFVESLEFKHGKIVQYKGCIDEISMASRNGVSRRGFVALNKDGSFSWTEDYLPIVRDQYLEFRKAYLALEFI